MSLNFEGEEEEAPLVGRVRMLVAFLGGAALGTGAVLMLSPSSAPPSKRGRRMAKPEDPD